VEGTIRIVYPAMCVRERTARITVSENKTGITLYILDLAYQAGTPSLWYVDETGVGRRREPAMGAASRSRWTILCGWPRKGTPVKMPRPRGAWSVLFLWRHAIRLALGRSSLAALSLGAPRFALPNPIGLPPGPLGAALRPHQRRLWRGRALHALTRALTLASVWLLLAAGVSWRLAAVPLALVWIPVAGCALAGIWGAFAQRPTALETARLLDRRFRLQDALGTAVDLGERDDPEALLPRRQRAAALGLLQRAPHNVWAAAPRREWLLAGGVIVLSLALVATASQRPRVVAGPSFGGHGSATGQRLLALAQNSQGARVGASASLFPTTSSTNRVTAKARIPTLSLSLQIHASPQGEQSSSLGAVPYLTGGSLGTSGKSTAHAGAKGAKGSASGNGGIGGGGQGQSGSGSGSPQAGGTGGQGAKSQGGNGLQTPQSGTQGTPDQTGSSGSSGGAGPNQKQSQQTTTDGANPFGQDQPQTGNSASASSHGKSGGRGSQGRVGTRQSTSTNGTRAGSGGKASGPAPNGQDDPNLLHRGRSGANGQLKQQPRTATHQAGPATGPQISLGGHYVISAGDQGQGLVRILPQGTAGGNGLQGSGYSGSPIVQGYIPEDATALSPQEQALVRAYFSGDGN